MEQTNYIIDYKGPVSSDTIDQLINQLKKEKKDTAPVAMPYKKIITVLIEALENIFKYTTLLHNFNNLKPSQQPIFIVQLIEDHYRVTIGNPILKADIENLKNKLNMIKQLDEEKLKELYIETIKNGQFTQQGGAGLGFIKMARLAEKRFDYKFEDIDNELSFFTMWIDLHD